MFCPKCGSAIEEGKTICTMCNFDVTDEIELSLRTIDYKQSIVNKLLMPNFFVYTIISVVVLIMFFIAANYISKGGTEIMSIKSVAGNSIEEAYYLNLGSIYAGYALIARALGIFFSAILVWLGLKK